MPVLRPTTDGVVTIRPPASGDGALLVAGRDDEFHRFLGAGSPDPDPLGCIVVGGDVVGWVDHDRDRSWLAPDEVNVGYHVFAPARGRGYATRAVKLLIHHLAVDTEARRATFLIDPANERSQAVARRVGARRLDDLDGNLYFAVDVPRSSASISTNVQVTSMRPIHPDRLLFAATRHLPADHHAVASTGVRRPAGRNRTKEHPMAVITMRQMLEAGVHFGHQTRRWNPKMKRFIFGERNGIYIIDLEQTLGRVETAYGFVRDLVANGGTILFVGTKKQAQDPVKSYAEKCGMPYVNERWLGGMLTNFETISKRVNKMLEYERMRASGEFDAMIKKEALLLERELTKLQRNLGGLRSMKKAPDAIFVLDTKKEHIAVTEANKLGIPVVAVVDTNVDPEVVQYPIPGNDDAIRSNSLFARVIADAVEEGRFIANKRNPAPVAAPERSAEEEAAFAAAQAAARDAAAQAQADRDARLVAAKAGGADQADADEQPAAEAAAPVTEAAAPVTEAAAETTPESTPESTES